MLKAMIYVLMGCWDMGVEGYSSPCGGVFLNSIEALWMIIRKNCFRPLIGVIISNRKHPDRCRRRRQAVSVPLSG